jgi:hypothetical protein
MIYLLNAPILTAYGEWHFKGPLTPEDVRAHIENQALTSAIGHEASATLLSRLLDRPVAIQRISVQLQPGDSAVVLRLCQRLPEGAILDAEQLANTPYELGWLYYAKSNTYNQPI